MKMCDCFKNTQLSITYPTDTGPRKAETADKGIIEAEERRGKLNKNYSQWRFIFVFGRVF